MTPILKSSAVTQDNDVSPALTLIWRASVACEALTGVTQLKIGDVCLLASERSEQDSIRGV